MANNEVIATNNGQIRWTILISNFISIVKKLDVWRASRVYDSPLNVLMYFTFSKLIWVATFASLRRRIRFCNVYWSKRRRNWCYRSIRFKRWLLNINWIEFHSISIWICLSVSNILYFYSPSKISLSKLSTKARSKSYYSYKLLIYCESLMSIMKLEDTPNLIAFVMYQHNFDIHMITSGRIILIDSSFLYNSSIFDFIKVTMSTFAVGSGTNFKL